MAAVNKELCAAIADRAASGWNRNKVRSKKMGLVTDLEESLNNVCEQITEGFSLM